jgi:peptidyl-prolyl cis-trans isomerase B (cyclophilin B)
MNIKIFALLIISVIALSGCTTVSTPASNTAETIETQPTETMTEDTKDFLELDYRDFEDLTAEYSSAVIKTSMGDITVEFHSEDSPKTVNNFLNLAKIDFYNGTKFHRVMKDFMIQGGDPNSKSDDWGTHGIGGPGYKFPDEFNDHKLVKGSLAMANSGPNTNGSQFFIVTLTATPWLDGHHTNFGQVTSGMLVAEAIENVDVNGASHPLEDVTINSIELQK